MDTRAPPPSAPPPMVKKQGHGRTRRGARARPGATPPAGGRAARLARAPRKLRRACGFTRSAREPHRQSRRGPPAAALPSWLRRRAALWTCRRMRAREPLHLLEARANLCGRRRLGHRPHVGARAVARAELDVAVAHDPAPVGRVAVDGVLGEVLDLHAAARVEVPAQRRVELHVQQAVGPERRVLQPVGEAPAQRAQLVARDGDARRVGLGETVARLPARRPARGRRRPGARRARGAVVRGGVLRGRVRRGCALNAVRGAVLVLDRARAALHLEIVTLPAAPAVRAQPPTGRRPRSRATPCTPSPRRPCRALEPPKTRRQSSAAGSPLWAAARARP